MKQSIWFLCFVVVAEICFLSMTSEAIVDQEIFDKVIEDRQAGPAKDRLLWLHEQMLTQLNETTVQPFIYLGSFYDLYGYQSEACAAYEIAQQIDPNNFDAHFNHAIVAVKIGQHAVAESVFAKSVLLSVNEEQRSRCYYHMGLLALRNEDVESAANFFEKSYSEIKNWPSFYERLRISVNVNDKDFFMGNIDECISIFDRSTEIYHLKIRAGEVFEEYAPKVIHELASRKSMLYQEFDVEKESRMRAKLGLNLNEIFESELTAQTLSGRVQNILNQEQHITVGKRLYHEAQCSLCHGSDASGQVGPNLTDDYWLHGSSIREIYTSISEGNQHMPAMKFKLSSEQVCQLVAYIISINQLTHKSEDGSSRGNKPKGIHSPIKY